MKTYTQNYLAKPRTKRIAKTLRRPLTPAENRFWYYVRNRRMLGLKFRRQHPLNKFIADFYCHELKLVVEIDGTIHDLKRIQEYDLEREAQIKNLGLTVLRFSNDDVFRNGDFIEREIRSFAETRGKFVPL